MCEVKDPGFEAYAPQVHIFPREKSCDLLLTFSIVFPDLKYFIWMSYPLSNILNGPFSIRPCNWYRRQRLRFIAPVVNPHTEDVFSGTVHGPTRVSSSVMST